MCLVQMMKKVEGWGINILICLIEKKNEMNEKDSLSKFTATVKMYY